MNDLSPEEHSQLLATLQARFEKNMKRHANLTWAEVQARLEAKPEKLRVLQEMERSGGEPDVVAQEEGTGAILFYDCAAESPAERRSLCYDRQALEARKSAKPADSAINRAEAMGVTLLNEAEYRALQELGDFDTKTSSWLLTPADIRARGGAIFGDYRFGRVFVYHNSADSYYGSRGFRGSLKV